MRSVLTGLLCVFAAVAAEAATLPSGYDAVEYIESTPGGGQYIDTEYTHKTTTKIVCELNVNSDNSSDTWHFAFGARAAASHEPDSHCLAFLAVDHGASAKVGYDRSLYGKLSEPNEFPYNTRVAVTCEGLDLSWSSSGQPVKTLHVDGGNDDGDRSLYIFALHNADKWADTLHHTAMKLYSFKIYEGDVLKRDFVPCVETATGKAGLYDLAEGKFHGNAGSGEFLQPLPSGYVAIEYIESTMGDGQYINTGYVPKKTTKVDCVVNVSAGQVTSHAVVFGAHSASLPRNKNMSFFAWFGGYGMTAYNRGDEERQGSSFGYGSKVRLICEGSKANWSSTDEQRQLGEITNPGVILDGDSAYPLYIFALDEPNADNPGQPFDHTYLAMKLYSFKIYEGDVLKRDFVPCIETGSGRAGLYDCIHQKFYSSAGRKDFRTGLVVVPYWEPVTKSEKIEICKVVKEDTSKLEGGKWYAVTDHVRRGTITVDTGAHLVLCDGATLEAEGGSGEQGIKVTDRDSLHIHGQVGGTGALVVKGGENGAGIGGGKRGAGGTVTIDGGRVTALGGWGAAGIGGGHEGAGGTVTINGGTVTVTGGNYGAGIGGGWNADGGSLTINGGTVTATGGWSAAGIGNGRDGGIVTINGGMVTAIGTNDGAGIGGGYDRCGLTVTINGGTVMATGSGCGAGIGGCRHPGGMVTVNGGTVTAIGGDWHSAGIGGGGGAEGAGGSVTINGGTVTARGNKRGAGIGGGGYEGPGGTVMINGGTVMATGGTEGGAGIGGGKNNAGGMVTIDGGTVTATGGGHGADIGGGEGGTGATVTINGGSVKANRIDNQPVNGEKKPLQRVTVPTVKIEDPADGMKIEGLPAYYNTAGIHPVENAIYLWLPSSQDQADGRYLLSVSDGRFTRYYFVVVAGSSVTVMPLTAGFRVNGTDIADASGDGWNYDADSGLLTLNRQMNYVIEGCASNDLVKVVVAANATVTLSNAAISVSSASAITVNNDFTLKLSAVGDSPSCLLAGNQPAISGGTTIIEAGSLCLWSGSAVPVSGAFSVAQNEIMCVGANADELKYVEKYEPKATDRILLVGPRCHLGVPGILNATVEVSSSSERLNEMSKKDGVSYYDLMLGDTANVRVRPNAGYVLRGPVAVRNIEIEGDRTLAPSELPVALKTQKTNYRAVTVDESGVKYRTESVEAVLFDEALDRLDCIGKADDLVGTSDENWYVVTGRVECGAISIVDTTLNLILGAGAELALSGGDGEPGVGVMANAFFNVYGCADGVGTLVAFGGDFAAGIGGGGALAMDGNVPDADAGTITVNGGKVIAFGGAFGAGIGGGAFGKGAELTVNGGSVFAYGGYDAEDIGGGSFGENKVTVVNGGNVMGNSVEVKPVNATGAKLNRVYVVSENFVPTNDVPLAVVGLVGYGTGDMFANEDGAICFYLPNGAYEFTVNGVKYVAEVWDATANAEVSEEPGDESGENEGESEEGGGKSAEVLGIEVGKKVLVTVRSKADWTYRLRRVTFAGGKMVEGDVVWSATADGDTLELTDDEPPAGSGFYVVEESEL